MRTVLRFISGFCYLLGVKYGMPPETERPRAAGIAPATAPLMSDTLTLPSKSKKLSISFKHR